MNKAKHSFAVLVFVLLCFCGGCGREGGDSENVENPGVGKNPPICRTHKCRIVLRKP